MHGWVLHLIRLWASHLRCDSAGKINNAGDDRLRRLPITPIRSWVEEAGLSAPVLHEGTAGAQSSVNSCRVLCPLFRVLTFISPRFTDLLCEVPPSCLLCQWWELTEHPEFLFFLGGGVFLLLQYVCELPAACCLTAAGARTLFAVLKASRGAKGEQRFPSLRREEMRRKTLSVAGFFLAWKLVQLLR